ncbi:MAG: hypothetical protein HY749_19990 [Gammaproteobacteria bacterium]|nr:hypothetical protein [Gammaproteobacteria bacterium]MBI5615353.1 hypothetical protein [Gammaproteobacteria bacterium]
MTPAAARSTPTGSATPAIPPRPAIVAALHDEARTLVVRGAPRPDAVRAEISGVGFERATRTGRALVARGATALMSWGTAGALDVAARPGEVLIYRAVRWRDGAEYACDPAWVAALAVRLAPLAPRVVLGLSSPHAVFDEAERRALHAATGATAVDMETAALAAVAADAGIPFVALRCVVDPVGFAVPRSAIAGLAPDGTSRPGRTIATLVKRPYELPDLLRLASWYRLALKQLRAAAGHCRPDFAYRP